MSPRWVISRPVHLRAEPKVRHGGMKQGLAFKDPEGWLPGKASGWRDRGGRRSEEQEASLPVGGGLFPSGAETGRSCHGRGVGEAAVARSSAWGPGIPSSERTTAPAVAPSRAHTLVSPALGPREECRPSPET